MDSITRLLMQGSSSGLTTGWNLSTAVYSGTSFSLPSADIQGIFFRDDGAKMYAIGTTGDLVYEYDLTTPWNISTLSYVQSFSVSTQEGNPQDVFFKPDGTEMYVIGTANDNVIAYSLSTAWNISTASFSNSFSVSAQDTAPQGLFFKPDGSKMYIEGNTGDDVNEYSLSTSWGITTASYVQNKSTAFQDTDPQNIYFRSDGGKMYFVGTISDAVYEYNLSIAWDISTLTYVRSFSVASQSTSPAGLFFKSDGTQMYVADSSTNTLYAYNL